MASGFAAQLLDELMGRNRDINPAERQQTHWSDPEICKFYLCAFCPNDLFTNTRSNLGRCDKIHDEDFKASYQKSGRFEKMGYERDFTRYLEGLISEIDRKIERGQQRLILNMQPNPGPSTPQAAARIKRIEFLTERINQLVEEAETLGCEGNVEQAQSVMVMCEKMRDERTTLNAINEAELKAEMDPSKSMEVCKVCGALLVLADLQLRPKDHIMGKQHMGYARIRSYIEGRKQPTAAGSIGASSTGRNSEVDNTSTDGVEPGGTVAVVRDGGERSASRQQTDDRYASGERTSRVEEERRGGGGKEERRSQRGERSARSRSRESRSPDRRKRRGDGDSRDDGRSSRRVTESAVTDDYKQSAPSSSSSSSSSRGNDRNYNRDRSYGGSREPSGRSYRS